VELVALARGPRSARMRVIALVIPSLELGGAARSLVKLVNGIGASFDEVHVVCMTSSDRDLVGEFDLGERMVLHELAGGKSANPLLWFRVRRVLKQIRPQVVVGWSCYANLVVLVATRAMRGIKVVVSERIYVPRMHGKGSRGSRLRKRLTLAAIRCLYRYADIVTANSRKNLVFLRKFVGRGPGYHLLPNMVDVSHLDIRAREPLPESIPIRAGPRLLAVGRLDHQKGFDILIEAMAKVRRVQPWTLVMVGDGPEGEGLKSLARRLGIGDALQWVGRTANPFAMYCWADLVIVPSRYEGFPNVLLEAMACGRAVICSNCETGPAELTVGGQFGRLVPVGDTEAMAEAILELGASAEARRALGQAARAHVQATYEARVVVEQYLQILGRGH